jgi:hypothetical protein
MLRIWFIEKLSAANFNTQLPHLYFGAVERKIIESAKDCQTKQDKRTCGMRKGFRDLFPYGNERGYID